MDLAFFIAASVSLYIPGHVQSDTGGKVSLDCWLSYVGDFGGRPRLGWCTLARWCFADQPDFS